MFTESACVRYPLAKVAAGLPIRTRLVAVSTPAVETAVMPFFPLVPQVPQIACTPIRLSLPLPPQVSLPLAKSFPEARFRNTQIPVLLIPQIALPAVEVVGAGGRRCTGRDEAGHECHCCDGFVHDVLLRPTYGCN